ncbi:hypothetical protein I5M32_07675 [Pedobacter sp. SD-b]|uniref:Uncharacterized protein n=1 Tax=Pedobacter segetis TaxID=2793069 RepID=A0ABS1BIW9_9SPHI|nr:hypothetical protein [Pedobacter segetis]MBK0382837.1 hypothetical protein [Pedobacter segetis]
MKTSIIKNGISFSEKDNERLKCGSLDLGKFLFKYTIDNPEVNNAVSQVLVDLNNTDGGGPMAILKSLEPHLIKDDRYGKVNFAYELKLEWGCSAIKKELLKHETFDFEINHEKRLLYLFLFIPA